MDLLEGLNESQAEAVRVASGPILILAGAGTGKTRTLTHRIAYLIQHHKVDPRRILAVTFTNKAAKEMEDRLAKLLAVNHNFSKLPWMGTFHSVCVKILRNDGLAIGVNPSFVIYDEDDRLRLAKEVLGGDKAKAKRFCSVLSMAKNSLCGPDEFLEDRAYPDAYDTRQAYLDYEQARQENRALDFDDLLLETVRLLKTSALVREKYRQLFQYILIDEYQDTNSAQYQIVKLLVNDQQNICVVGDDWQSIYSWRGADFHNILNFEKDFKKAKIIKLEQNYRSTQQILDGAGELIQHNQKRTSKKLRTARQDGEPIKVYKTFNETEEANLVAQKIKDLKNSGRYRYDEMAVLYRINAQSYGLERALIHNSIPYKIIGGLRFYDRAEVKDVLAYLRVVFQPSDTISFKRIANVPGRKLGPVSLKKFLDWKKAQKLDLIEALLSASDIPTLPAGARKSLEQLGQIFQKLKKLAEDKVLPAVIMGELLNATRYIEYLTDNDPSSEERIANINSLLLDTERFNSLEDFITEASLLSSADTESEKDRVSLMTLHASKGLEFPVVFVVGLEDGILPHTRALFDEGNDIEEERRLFYVGMTRAKDKLCLSYALSRFRFGTIESSHSSRFLDEIPSLVYDQESLQPVYGVELDESDDFFGDLPFSVGDRVQSTIFGEGVVIDVDGGAVEIEFDRGGVKKVNPEFAGLKKL